MELLKKIESKQARLGVIGLGYVGLPLAVEFARAGFTVIGYDVDARRVGELMAGRSYIPDVPSAHLAEVVKNGTFIATTDPKKLGEVDIIDICVPTPLRKTKDPDMTYVVQVRGADVPLAGRIVAVADVFDALTQQRPYKPAWPVAEAIAEIDHQRERQFDPAVVDAFLRVIQSSPETLPKNST